MLAQLKTLSDADARAELLAKLGAWWDGKDYDPAASAAAQAGDGKDAPATERDAREAIRPMEKDRKLSKAPPRVAALETIWGRGRYMPGNGELDVMLIEALGRVRGRIGKLALVGVDGIAADALALTCGETVALADWRGPCADRSREVAENAMVSSCDLDRLNCFEDGSLKALLSVDAMTYADHKPGLSARMYRALRDGGRWALLDYSVNPDFVPKASFASAWREPQMIDEATLRGHLETTGFRVARCDNVTETLLQAARTAFMRLGPVLEDIVSEGADGRDGALMLQELSWEAAAWRARIRALELGVLRANLWVAEKPGGSAPTDEPVMAAPASMGPVDAEPPHREPAQDMEEDLSLDDLLESPDEEPAAEAANGAAEESEVWDVDGDDDGDDADDMDQSAVDSLFD